VRLALVGNLCLNWVLFGPVLVHQARCFVTHVFKNKPMHVICVRIKFHIYADSAYKNHCHELYYIRMMSLKIN
jgi:hypothetical protein